MSSPSRTSSGKSRWPFGRMSTSPHAGDFVALAEEELARDRPGCAGILGVVRDGDVLVAKGDARGYDRFQRVLAVTVGRVHVEVATDVAPVHEGGQGSGAGRLHFAGVVAQFGRNPGETGLRVEILLARHEPAEPTAPDDRADVGVRPGRQEECRAVFVRRGNSDVYLGSLEPQQRAPSAAERYALGARRRADRFDGGGRVRRPSDQDQRANERFEAPHVSRRNEVFEPRVTFLQMRLHFLEGLDGAPQRQGTRIGHQRGHRSGDTVEG